MSSKDAPVQNHSSTPSARPSRRGLYLPYLLLGLVAIVWSGLWFYAATMAGRVADGFVAREATRGRDWACPNRTIGGYPFRIELTCDKPRLIGRGADGLTVDAGLAGLSLHGSVFSPGHFIAVMQAPFTARLDADREMTLAWKSARASFRGGKQSLSDASFEMLEPVLTLGLGETEDQKSRARAIEVHLRRSPGDVAGSDLVLRASEISVPMVDRRIGTPEPLTLEVQATAPGLVFEPNRSARDLLEAWRIAGGKARVIVAKASKGQAAIDLSGTLGLDAERRLEGNLQGRARNLESITGQLGRRQGLNIGNLLGKITGGQGMPVALTFENGRVRFGPFPLAELGPLY